MKKKIQEARDSIQNLPTEYNYDQHEPALHLLLDLIEALAHKVQELEPEEYTEEDMEGFYAEHSRQLEKHNLAHQLCDRVMSSESATNMDTFRIANRLKELLDATKGT